MIILGNNDLYEQNLAAVLNSSQSKTPCGDDPWIEGTVRAIENLIKLNYTVVTSLYMITWELAVYLTGKSGGNQIIVGPVVGNDDGYNIFCRTIDQFRLDKDKTAMGFVKPGSGSGRPKAAWFKRDKAVFDLAGILFPVSIRPGGKLERLLSETGKTVNTDFKIQYIKPTAKARRYEFSDIDLMGNERDYIIHWTRTCHGPWPGESKYDYYEKLVSSGEKFTHCAYNTLKNIIESGVIRASSKRIRKSIRSIGFSDLEPKAMLNWMRWLPSRVNWNFEPYGIAIRKSSAEKLGIRKVVYGDDETYDSLPDPDKPYFQSRGSGRVDWSDEHEWRHIGDLNLEKIPHQDLAVITWKKDEAEELSALTNMRTYCFNGG